jgi:outer membrane protein insertion porin family
MKTIFMKICTILFALSLTIPLQGNTKKLERWKIKSVTFENNRAYTDQRLCKIMVSRPPSLFGSTVYRKDIFEEDMKNIVLFYHQNGYLEARVVDFRVEGDSSRNEVRLIVVLEEGKLTRIEGLGVFGNRAFNDARLLEHIKIKTGDPLNRIKVEKSLLDLLRFYADCGYLEADINPEVRINPETHMAILDFIIREGHQFTVGNIMLDGIEKTHPHVILRELQFKKGDVLDYSRLLETQRRIYMTGLVQSVFVRPVSAEDGDSTKKDIRIEVKENPSIELNVSAGYGTVDRLRGKVEVFNKNFRGSARKVGLVTTMSFIRRSVEASFTEPWTFGTPWRTDMTLGMEYKEEPGYHLRQIGGRLTVGRSFFQRSNIMVRFRSQQGKLSEISVNELPDDVKTDIRSLELAIIHDSRDNLFNATRGVYTELSGELGGSFSDRVHGFIRLVSKCKYFYSITPNTVLASGIEIGWMEAQGGLPQILLSERFYAGGPNSVRGFEYQKLGPVDEDGTPLGGGFKCVWNMIEIRKGIYKMLDGALFLDMGNVWSAPEAFRFREVRFSPGVGLRLNTPIGVGRIDLGVNIDQRSGEQRFLWSFSMGQAF